MILAATFWEISCYVHRWRRPAQPSDRRQYGGMHTVVERPVTFEYGYNMRCPVCPEVTALTSDEYYREDNQAHVACCRCGADDLTPLD